MLRGKQRAHGDGLVDTAEYLALEVGFEFGVVGFFSFAADIGHFEHGFQREFTRCGFGTQHHGIGTVQHGIGHVADLGTGGHRVGDHAFHHLGGGNHHLVAGAGHADHAFLQCGHGGIADFNSQVTARHHDAVAGIQNGLQMGNRLGAFDLGNHAGLVAVFGSGYVA